MVAMIAGVLVASGCGSDVGDDGPDPAAGGVGELPTVVATTGIWADIVTNASCGLVAVETLIPAQADPHGFEPSLADRGRLDAATLVVANGLGLEEGLDDTLDASEAAGTSVFRIGETVDTITYATDRSSDDGGEDHEDDHGGEDHDDKDHDDKDHEEDDHDKDTDDHDEDNHDDHGHSGVDPHVWFDPLRVADSLDGLGDRLAAESGLDRAELETCIDDYRTELLAIDEEIEELTGDIPLANRKLITNHDSLGYFADRYGFEVIGTIIPTPSGLAETNPAQLQALAELIEETGVPAVFTEPGTSQDEADVLAEQLEDLTVVALPMGSLTEADGVAPTYIDLLLTNAEAIESSLGGE